MPTIPVNLSTTNVLATSVRLTWEQVTYPDAVLADSPVAYWRLGESSGTTAIDETISHDGIYSGGYTLGQTGSLFDDVDTATLMDGIDGNVFAGNHVDFQVSTGSIEVGVKISVSEFGFHGIISKENAYGLFVENDILLTFDWSAGVRRSTGINIADGFWHHVVMTFVSGVTDGSFIYLDGVLVLTFTYTILDQTFPLYIGRGSSTQHLNAVLDEPAVYDFALSATRVAAHFDAGSS